jgi:hypothetical protein
MFSQLRSTFVRSTLLLAAVAVTAAWLFSVPAALTTSSLAIVTLFAALAWVVQNSFTNGQPVPSLAQRIYDSEQGSETPARRRTK